MKEGLYWMLMADNLQAGQRFRLKLWKEGIVDDNRSQIDDFLLSGKE
jgi:hypothetical protein